MSENKPEEEAIAAPFQIRIAAEGTMINAWLEPTSAVIQQAIAEGVPDQVAPTLLGSIALHAVNITGGSGGELFGLFRRLMELTLTVGCEHGLGLTIGGFEVREATPGERGGNA